MMDRPEEQSEPLDPWMEAQVSRAMTPADASIPMDRMWARVAQAPRLVDGRVLERNDAAVAPRVIPTSPTRSRWRGPALLAAGLVLGVALGRFAWPVRSADRASANRVTAAGTLPAPGPLAATNVDTPHVAPMPSAPSLEVPSAALSGVSRTRRAMPITPVVAEHLQQTVAVLSAVRDGEHATDADSATRLQLQQLLTTTRTLLDEPGGRAARTHRLLQDLELVLAQLARARATAPATRAAADEAMRETNLLPRLRAAAEARSGSEEP
ncbi:MAG: hypothetical protein K2R93_16220 [Gemmatimonadaceae bacterium]|nr:hypothetical protein [Gemmatimonadaceae bacterium]